MRPMALEFPHDPAAEYLDRQYMLGDDLLVAPVFSPDGVVRYYVPEGTWTNVLNGERIAGPRWIEEQFDYMTMPLLARPGAVIPMQEGRCDTDGDLTDDVILKIYDPAALDSEWRQLVLRHGFEEDAAETIFRIRRTNDVLEVRCDSVEDGWAVKCGGQRVQAHAGAATLSVQ